MVSFEIHPVNRLNANPNIPLLWGNLHDCSPHSKMQCTLLWHGCIGTRNLDRVEPSDTSPTQSFAANSYIISLITFWSFSNVIQKHEVHKCSVRSQSGHNSFSLPLSLKPFLKPNTFHVEGTINWHCCFTIIFTNIVLHKNYSLLLYFSREQGPLFSHILHLHSFSG